MDKSATIVYASGFVTLVILLVALLTYFYYLRLPANECNLMDTVYGSLNGKIQSSSSSSGTYAFRDYYIKSAYNACSGGQYKNDYVDVCVLKNLLRQGVRGLDFEIFSIHDQPVVATSTNDSFNVKETFNSIAFRDVMNILSTYAFASSTAPNPLDPIIIHLRFKSAHPPMYQNFAKLLESFDSLLLGKEYDSEYYGQNFGAVPLSALMGKIVLLVERSNLAFMDCPEFYSFVNMTSNSMFMRCLPYYDVKYSPDLAELIDFNRQNMTIALPDKGTNPDNPNAVVLRETGCQLLAMRYSKIDTWVEESDVFFEEHGSAFVLKPENLRYIPVTIPAPPPQNPALSFAPQTVQSDFYQFHI